MLALRCFSGLDVSVYLPVLSALRMQVFREYPYCYDGDAEYEARYLQTYAAAPDSFFALCFDADTVVGAATAVPLMREDASMQQPFQKVGIAPETICYFGESVLLPAYRGRGIGHQFFDARERYAELLRQQGYPLQQLAFASVMRAEDDPRQPADYRSNAAFWRKRGYCPHASLQLQMHWRELGQGQETAHQLTVWLRSMS
jgi:GNAT superfamily N-acetyltransferase